MRTSRLASADPGFDDRPDMDGDNGVDIVDFSVLLRAFGSSCTVGP